MNIKTLKVIAIVLLVVIVLGAGIYWMVSGMSNRGLEGFQTPPTTTQPTTIPEPPTPSTILGNFRNANNTEWKVGKKYTFSVTGTNGTIWGGGDTDGTYTLDSPIAVAAVHAGIVPIGKTGIVNIIITAGQNSYTGSSRNSITSNKFAKPYEASYRFEKDGRYILKQNINTTLKIRIIGRAGFNIWGGGDVLATYTADSPVATAAVHAGIVKEGEDKEITILILPGIDTYIGVTRNGITSSNFGKYDKAYRFIDPALPLLNQDLGKIQSELEQKKNNLATAQSELSAASAALNNAIKSASVEGFQTVGTTTTTPQVVSPIMAKINQLRELQAQKAAEFAKAKLDLEAAKTEQAAQITSLQSNKSRLETEKTGLQSNKSRLETEKTGLQSNKSRLETEKTGLQSNKSRLETEKTELQSNKSRYKGEISAAETRLDLINQQLKTAVSQFQDIASVAATTTDKSLSDGLTSLDTQIKELIDAKKQAETDIAKLKAELSTANENLKLANKASTKLASLETLLQGSQFNISDSQTLASELANARFALNNPASQVTCPPQQACPPPPVCPPQQACPPPPVCPPQQACPPPPVCPPQQACPDTTALKREIDTKAALITDLEGKLGIANTTINQLNDKIANFDKALTNEERATLTDAKNSAERAKLEIEAEHNMAMTNRDELRAKYEACEAARRNMPANASPMMMGGIPPSYVSKAMTPNVGQAALDRYAMPVPPDRYPPFNPEPEMPAPDSLAPEVAGRLATRGNFGGMVGTDMPGTLQGTDQQQGAASTAGIADTNLTAQTGFTDIPKHKLQQLIQNARSNPYWTYRPENYDSHDRYAAPTSWWVTGYNA